VPQARGLARQLIFPAEGYAAQRINQATGQTQRFSALAAEYARYPKVTRTRPYFEAFEQAFAGSEATELIDKKWSASIFKKDTGEPSPTERHSAGLSR
jgi:membrane protease subunit HflK